MFTVREALVAGAESVRGVLTEADINVLTQRVVSKGKENHPGYCHTVGRNFAISQIRKALAANRAAALAVLAAEKTATEAVKANLYNEATKAYHAHVSATLKLAIATGRVNGAMARAAEMVEGLSRGLLTQAEACEMYELSTDCFYQWVSRIRRTFGFGKPPKL